MSRKHFERIAAELRFTRPEDDASEAFKVWRATVDGIADACASFNMNFDRERFVAACLRPVGR